MMQWFQKHHAQLSPFIEWTRAPAASMIANLSEMTRHAAELHQTDQTLGTTLAKDMLSPSKWAIQQEGILSRIATRMAKELLGESSEVLTAKLVDERCPGLSVGIRSLHSAWWTTTSRTPRQAKLSDFPDALHAMYAPYVDVFRADSFMAPYIAKLATKFGTTVVAKLADLSNAIQVALAKAA